MLLTKGLVGLAALIAGGFVTIDEVVIERGSPTTWVSIQQHSDTAGSVNYGTLHEQANSALNVLLERQKAADHAQVEASAQPRCQGQAWPYYSTDCLGSQDGSAKPVVRVVGFETPAKSLQPVSF